MGCLQEVREEVSGVLWKVSAKLHGLSEMFYQANAEQPYSEVGLTGLGYILTNLALELDDLRELVDFGPEEKANSEAKKVADANERPSVSGKPGKGTKG